MQVKLWPKQVISAAVTPLSADALHLYAVHVPACVRHAALFDCLSPKEQGRAEKQVQRLDRQRFQVVRGVLRHLLGQYLEQSPAAVRLQYSDLGKPSVLVEAGNPVPLHFSVSHSGDWGFYAFALHAEVGVDIECMRPDITSLALAKRFFHEEEVLHLQRLHAEDQTQAFYDLWVLKEAYVKARGLSLMVGLGISMLACLEAIDQPAMLGHQQTARGAVLAGLSLDVSAAWMWQSAEAPSLRCVRLVPK